MTSGLCDDVNYNETGVWASWELAEGAISASINITFFDSSGNASWNASGTFANLGGGFDVSFNAPPSDVDWSGGFQMYGSEYSGGGFAGDGTAYTATCF